jgi:hypothetical protein
VGVEHEILELELEVLVELIVVELVRLDSDLLDLGRGAVKGQAVDDRADLGVLVELDVR